MKNLDWQEMRVWTFLKEWQKEARLLKEKTNLVYEEFKQLENREDLNMTRLGLEIVEDRLKVILSLIAETRDSFEEAFGKKGGEA